MNLLHNECGLCLTVLGFATAYICTTVNGHEDVIFILWTAFINVLGRVSNFNLNQGVLRFSVEFIYLDNLKILVYCFAVQNLLLLQLILFAL